MQYSKEYTVRYNTSLSPTRGGVPSRLARSHALLHWSRVLACATTVSPFPTCPSHDVHVNFRVSKSFESRTVVRKYCTGLVLEIPYRLCDVLSTSLSTVRDCPSHRTGSFLLVHFQRHCGAYTVRYFQPNRSGLLLAIPYGLPTCHRSLSTVRDTFSHSFLPLVLTPYGISNPTGRDFSLQYRTGFQQASHVHISIYPVRLFTNHRTGLLVHIPYGILLPTTVSHIPENRTGLFFPPYGTIPFGRFKRHF
jgi:hypothetical protein